MNGRRVRTGRATIVILALGGAFIPGAVLLAAPPSSPAPHPSPRPADTPPGPTLVETLRPLAVVRSPLGLVVTSAPEASWAGARMLEAGGNAVDAAVAAAFALGSAEPGGSGLGGQTWLLIRLATGEERAVFCPSRIPLRFSRAKVKADRQGKDLWGPTAAAVPTTVATLAHVLDRYGTKSFAEVLAPAIEAADAGYRIQVFEAGYLAEYKRRLFDSEVLSPVYLTGATGESGIPEPAPVGTCVRIPGLAETLRRLAEAGPSDFYTGSIAARFERDVKAAGGFIGAADLARVASSVVDTAPVRGSYRGRTVLSVPWPAGGSILVSALQILDALPSATLAAPGLARGHAVVEAVRIALSEAAARGNRAEVTDGPLRAKWLTREWAAEMARRIRPDRALTRAELHGEAGLFAGDRGTSHLSVVDAQGNAVSLTQTLGRYYGASWAPPSLGFLMNAFAEPLDSDDPASPLYAGPGVPTSSPVAPVVLVEEGRTVLVAGTGGSARITSKLLDFLANVVDGRREIVDASALPRLISDHDANGTRILLEMAPPFTPDLVASLKAMGYANVFVLSAPGFDAYLFGGIHSVSWNPGASAWEAVIDGRRPMTIAAPSPSPASSSAR